MAQNTVTEKTFKLELARGFFDGILQSGFQTVGILILVEMFSAQHSILGVRAESIIFSAGFAGMLATVLFTPGLGRTGLRTSLVAALPIAVAAMCCAAAAAVDSATAYTLLISCGFALLPLRIPLMTQIYATNYPQRRRGFYLSITLIVMQISTIGFGWLAGETLETNPSYFRWIIIAMALSCIGVTTAIAKMPSEIYHAQTQNPAKAFRWLYRDPLFGYVILAWFLLGFANLWILPLRITYLKEEIGLGPRDVALLLAVVPEVARLIFLPVWGWLFDRLNFIALRIAMNLFLAAGVACFFFTETYSGFAIGSFLHGVGFAGGRIAWGLWVTKMVPPDRVSDYMTVHVGITGLRGLVAPAIGYGVVAILGGNHQAYHNVGLISVVLMMTASLMLVPVIKKGHRSQTE